jgi:hypothetical protein
MIARSEVAALRSQLSPLRLWPTLFFLVFGVAVRWIAFSLARRRERSAVYRAALGGYLGAIFGRGEE